MPILFFALFLFPQKTGAQAQPSITVVYDQFICLFEKTTTTGKCPNPSPSVADIKTGAASGIVYGKTDPAGFTDTGIKTIIMQMGLWADVAKEGSEPKYFYHRVADDKSETFLIRLSYKDPSGNKVYSLFDIPYQKNNIQVNDVDDIRTVTVDTTSGSVQAAIAFYKVDAPSGKEVITQQVVLAKVQPAKGAELPYGTELAADFWYCGGLSDANSAVDGRRAPRDGDRVEYFTSDGKYKDINGDHSDGIAYGTTKCGGTAYYKIGATTIFNLPSKEAVQADSQQTLDSGIVSSSYIGSTLPLCSIDPFTDGSVMGCIAQILYGGIFRPVAFFAQLMGKLFDFFLGYSLSDESYRHDFIQTGWQLVRDISNIFFIIIMIWSGLVAIFNTSSVSYKKVIPTLIINALIINFSLFATRVIIDVSNITARIFYNQMVVKVNGEVTEGAGGFKPISEAIVSSFNPQKIFEGSVLTSEDVRQNGTNNTENDGSNFNGQQNLAAQSGKFQRYSKEYASYFALVTLVAIAISFSVGMMFWKTAFMFVGRVVGLYVAMIFSPFAFLSRGGVPLVGKIPELNYGSWWKDLSQYALLAPIFVFFLYIINAFLNVQFFTKVGLDQNAQGFFGSVMYVMIPMLIIYGLVSQGASIAKNLAGKYGNMAQSFATTATGFVGGAALTVASAGTAKLGTGIGARAGKIIGNSRVGRWAAKNAENNFFARKVSNGLDWTQKSSWDPRKTKLGELAKSNALFDRMSIKTAGGTKLAGSLGLGEKQFEGGSVERAKRRAEAAEKRLREKISGYTYLSKENVQKVWGDKSDELIGKEAMKAYLDKTDATFKTQTDEVKAAKKEVEDLKKKVKAAEADLRTENKLSDDQKKAVADKLIEDKKALKEKEDFVKTTNNLQLQAIESLMNDKSKEKAIRESRDYKDSYDNALKASNAKFGKVESGKDLENAMRRVYFENVRERSIWMRDNKQRGWLPAMGLSGMLTSLLTKIGFWGHMAVGGVTSAILADEIKSEQEAIDSATSSFLKNYDKTKKTSDRAEKYKQTIKDANDLIQEHLAQAKGVAKEDIKLDEIDLKEQEEKIKERVAEMQAEMAAKEEDYKTAADAYRRGGSSSAFKDAAKAKQKAKDDYEELKNVWENRRKAEEGLDKEQNK